MPRPRPPAHNTKHSKQGVAPGGEVVASSTSPIKARHAAPYGWRLCARVVTDWDALPGVHAISGKAAMSGGSGGGSSSGSDERRTSGNDAVRQERRSGGTAFGGAREANDHRGRRSRVDLGARGGERSGKRSHRLTEEMVVGRGTALVLGRLHMNRRSRPLLVCQGVQRRSRANHGDLHRNDGEQRRPAGVPLLGAVAGQAGGSSVSRKSGVATPGNAWNGEWLCPCCQEKSERVMPVADAEMGPEGLEPPTVGL